MVVADVHFSCEQVLNPPRKASRFAPVLSDASRVFYAGVDVTLMARLAPQPVPIPSNRPVCGSAFREFLAASTACAGLYEAIGYGRSPSQRRTDPHDRRRSPSRL